jgi:hypothetical protein
MLRESAISTKSKERKVGKNMQCKDCLSEIDESEYFNRSMEGVCRKCRQKISQIKYENKKFGTKREYVPARLKGLNSTSKKVVKKATKKVVAKTKVVEEAAPVEKKIYDEKTENIVLDDINKTFKAYNVNINLQEIPPFNVFMEMFCSLIDVNNGYMSQYKKAEEIFNMMEGDYQHAVEDAQTPDLFLERSKMFRCLLDQRRAIKNGIGQYDKISDMLQDIVKKNPKILEVARNSRDELNKTIESQEGHFYKARASTLISKEPFCVGKRDWGKWHVSVPIMNYYNNGTIPYLFERDVWAEGEGKAIENVKEYLKQKFPKCPYKEVDFKAEKIQESDKECL